MARPQLFCLHENKNHFLGESFHMPGRPKQRLCFTMSVGESERCETYIQNTKSKLTEQTKKNHLAGGSL